MTFSSTEPKFSDSDNILLAKILQQLIENPGGGGGGGGSQTPWTSNINGNHKNLSNANTITATSFVGALTGNASTASVAPAGTLTGTTLAANVVTSSLTTVGTLGSLNVSGTSALGTFSGTFATDDFGGEPTFVGNVTFDANVIWNSGAAILFAANNTVDIGTNAVRSRIGYFGTSVIAPSFVGALTGAASSNVLKAGDTMTGALLFTDNTVDIGASGATRPRRGYFGTEVVSPLFTGALTGAASSNVLKAGDTMTGLLQFSGTTHAGVKLLSLTTTQRDALTPSAGMVIYNSTTAAFQGYTSSWAALGGGGAQTPWTSNIDAAGFNLSALGTLTFNTDVILARDAANVLAQRNAGSAQELRVYGNYTDASNFNRIDIKHLGGTSGARVEVSALGTGGVGPLQFAVSLTAAAPTNIFNISTSGHLLWNTDNTYNIGASSASRPAAIYAGLGVFAPTFQTAGANLTGGSLTLSAANSILFYLSTSIVDSSNGVLLLMDFAGTSFGRLQLGGTTSSFPALGRSTTRLTVGLADGSAGGGINFSAAAVISVASGTNQRAGNATLVGGTVTVNNTTVTANSIVMLTRKTSGGTIGTAITYTLSAGTSFTVNSDNILDTSTFSYLIIEVP